MVGKTKGFLWWPYLCPPPPPPDPTLPSRELSRVFPGFWVLEGTVSFGRDGHLVVVVVVGVWWWWRWCTIVSFNKDIYTHQLLFFLYMVTTFTKWAFHGCHKFWFFFRQKYFYTSNLLKRDRVALVRLSLAALGPKDTQHQRRARPELFFMVHKHLRKFVILSQFNKCVDIPMFAKGWTNKKPGRLKLWNALNPKCEEAETSLTCLSDLITRLVKFHLPRSPHCWFRAF